MNNENNALLHNDVEINVSEENIILAPPVELFDEAKEIAQSTLYDEKFPFSLQYDSNQKEFLLSMLEAVGAIVEDDDDDGHILATMMNMTQLAFIKQLDCVERVKTDEGINPFLAEEADKLTPIQQEDEALDDEVQLAVTDIYPETLEAQTEIALNRITDAELEAVAIAETEQADGDIAVASVTATARNSCCPCPTNVAWKLRRPFPMKAIRADTSVAPELNSGLSLLQQEPVSTPFALRVIWIPSVLFTIVAAIRLPELTIMLLAERSISVLSAISPKEIPTISRWILAKGM